MKPARIRQHTAWLLVVAMIVAALAQAAPRAWAGGAGGIGGAPGLHDICFVDPAAAPGRSGGERDAPGAPHAGGHCAMCVVHGALAAPAIETGPGLAVPRSRSPAFAAVAAPPRSSFDRWAPASPRAPPRIG